MRNTILAVLMVMAVVAGQIPTNGLVARYDFTSGALTDGSGSGRTLAPVGIGATLTADRDLFPNNAYLFQGNLSGTYQGNDDDLPIGSADRSICFWLSLVEKGDTCMQILSYGTYRWSTSDTINSFRVVFRKDTLCIQQHGIRYAKTKVTNAQFPANGTYDNPWTHVALVINANQVSWYINGSLHSSSMFPGLSTSVASNTYFSIGGEERSLKSKIDEVLVYNRALTPTEAHGIYDPEVNVLAQKVTAPRKCVSKNASYTLNGRIFAGKYEKTNTPVFINRAK